jgi:hypothetical protein
MLTTLNGPIIAAGQSLSDALDCTAGTILRIRMPPNWTAGANLSFQTSSDGVNFGDLYDINGHEIQIPVVPGAHVSMSTLADHFNYIFLKLRSGSCQVPVVQDADRAFGVVLSAGGN